MEGEWNEHENWWNGKKCDVLNCVNHNCKGFVYPKGALNSNFNLVVIDKITIFVKFLTKLEIYKKQNKTKLEWDRPNYDFFFNGRDI